MERAREVVIERIDAAARADARDHVVVEEALEVRARGKAVATIMRTPGHDIELVRGLLHAESVEARSIEQVGDDAVDTDADPAAFAPRGLLATAACGVCGRVAIDDLEKRARPVEAKTTIARATLAAMPDKLRLGQALFQDTGGVHCAALFHAMTGKLIAAREDVGRHNAVDKLVGWALRDGLDPGSYALLLSGRAGYELVQKAVMLGVPIVAAVSAPSSLAIEIAERFRVALVGFVRGERCNIYSHGWRIA